MGIIIIWFIAVANEQMQSVRMARYGKGAAAADAGTAAAGPWLFGLSSEPDMPGAAAW